MGSNLIRTLNFKKYEITILSKNRRIKKNLPGKIKYFFCDIGNYKKLKKVKFQKYNFIINFSGNINHKDKTETNNVHHIGLKNLIKLIDKDHLDLFIQIGTSLEYGNYKSPQNEFNICKPNSNYGIAKYQSSKYIEKNLDKYVILRLYQVYGPYQKKDRLVPFVIDKCLKKKSFNCSDGKQFRDFLYVDDLSRLIVKILKTKIKNSSVFNVGYGKPIKVKSLINKIVSMIKTGTPKFGKIKMRKDEIFKLYPDIKKVKKVFKWQPRISICNGLNRTIKFYEKN